MAFPSDEALNENSAATVAQLGKTGPGGGAGGSAGSARPVGAVIAGVLFGVALVLTFWGAKQLVVVGNCGTSNYYALAVDPCPSGVVPLTLVGFFGIIIFGLALLVANSRGINKISLAAVAAGVVLGGTVMWDALPEPVTKESRDARVQEAVDEAERQAEAVREEVRKQVEEALKER